MQEQAILCRELAALARTRKDIPQASRLESQAQTAEQQLAAVRESLLKQPPG